MTSARLMTPYTLLLGDYSPRRRKDIMNKVRDVICFLICSVWCKSFIFVITTVLVIFHSWLIKIREYWTMLIKCKSGLRFDPCVLFTRLNNLYCLRKRCLVILWVLRNKKKLYSGANSWWFVYSFRHLHQVRFLTECYMNH